MKYILLFTSIALMCIFCSCEDSDDDAYTYDDGGTHIVHITNATDEIIRVWWSERDTSLNPVDWILMPREHEHIKPGDRDSISPYFDSPYGYGTARISIEHPWSESDAYLSVRKEEELIVTKELLVQNSK
ncbi:hypothetical protein ACFLS1_11250 [Verrucomicrobiota bacterium]